MDQIDFICRISNQIFALKPHNLTSNRLYEPSNLLNRYNSLATPHPPLPWSPSPSRGRLGTVLRFIELRKFVYLRNDILSYTLSVAKEDIFYVFVYFRLVGVGGDNGYYYLSALPHVWEFSGKRRRLFLITAFKIQKAKSSADGLSLLFIDRYGKSYFH